MFERFYLGIFSAVAKCEPFAFADSQNGNPTAVTAASETGEADAAQHKISCASKAADRTGV